MSNREMRIVIAHPEPLFRRGLAGCLANEQDARIVAEVAGGAAAIEEVERHQATVLVVSTHIAEPTLPSVCQQIDDGESGCRVLAIARDGNRDETLLAARHGAHGLCLTTSTPQAFCDAIRDVHTGRPSFSMSALEHILADYVGLCSNGLSGSQRSASPFPAGKAPSPAVLEQGNQLSKREKQVLSLVAQGMTSREIAEELSISSRTVEAHRARISSKLGIRTVAGLTRFAMKMGLTQSPR